MGDLTQDVPLSAVSDRAFRERAYVASDEAFRFIAFLRAAGIESNVSPEAHYKIADALFSSDEKDWKVVIECLRGMGKSTVLEYAVIYVAALGTWPGFGKVPFLVFLGASQEGNVKAFFKNIAGKIFASDFLQSLFLLDTTNYRQTDSELELTNKDGVITCVAGRGMSVNWRGIRSRFGHRPSVIIADDILSNDVMTSEAIRETIEVNWFNSALPAIDPEKYKIIYIGTPLSEEDLMHKLKNSGVYRIIKFPLCSKFPCSEEEYDSVWPSRFNYKYACEIYEQFLEAGREQSFFQEYMLQLTDRSTRVVEEEDIRWFDKETFMKNRGAYNLYIVTDFATSTKKKADFSTIGIIAVSSNNDWLLVDGQCKRQGMNDNLEDLFRYVSKWRPTEVGIETSGQQGGYISIIEERMMRTGVWFQLAKRRGSKEIGIRPIADKLRRFVLGVQPQFKQGKVWLPRVESLSHVDADLKGLVEELVHELSRLTMSGGVKALAHDDALDLFNQFSEMDTYTPTAGSNTDIEDARKADSLFWGDTPDSDYDAFQGSTVF